MKSPQGFRGFGVVDAKLTACRLWFPGLGRSDGTSGILSRVYKGLHVRPKRFRISKISPRNPKPQSFRSLETKIPELSLKILNLG